ncbi:hypothetical protein BJX76DRAFT_338761 [Aspergillus varians]
MRMRMRMRICISPPPPVPWAMDDGWISMGTVSPRPPLPPHRLDGVRSTENRRYGGCQGVRTLEYRSWGARTGGLAGAFEAALRM